MNLSKLRFSVKKNSQVAIIVTMATRLKLYDTQSIPKLLKLYDSAYRYAKSVGDIDWVYPFPKAALEQYIGAKELFGLNYNPDRVSSSVRLYENAINSRAINMGKLTVDRSLKGTDFTRKRLLPAIIDEAHKRSKSEILLTCLATNTRLVNFYKSLGFVEIDERAGLADAGYNVVVKEMKLLI